ncbi:response regulator transcription factor [Endozoicomonas sp.]|uniref:response regulator transcription factor n=1 Tax=Endozoicomonas sp. TaxID=1892382 RepID=UPI00383B0681
MRILLVEDNIDITASIADYLEFQGYTCDFAYDGLTGLNLATNHEYDIYILDIAMPGMNGLELCQTLRKTRHDHKPVLFLTARDTLDDKLAGFASGGDDYLVKPFELKELHARLQAVCRRTFSNNAKRLALADLTINMDTLEVTRNGIDIQLSPNNYKLLLTLLKESPNVVTRETLEYQLWGDSVPDSDSLRSHIYKLRQLIDKPFDPPLIHTVPGRGFRMVEK